MPDELDEYPELKKLIEDMPEEQGQKEFRMRTLMAVGGEEPEVKHPFIRETQAKPVYVHVFNRECEVGGEIEEHQREINTLWSHVNMLKTAVVLLVLLCLCLIIMMIKLTW